MNDSIRTTGNVRVFIAKLYKPLMEKLKEDTGTKATPYILTRITQFVAHTYEISDIFREVFEEYPEEIKECYTVLRYAQKLYNLSHPTESYAVKEAMNILFPFPVQSITPDWEPDTDELTPAELTYFTELKERIKDEPDYLLLAQKMFEYTLLN